MGVGFSGSLQCHKSYKAWDFRGIEEEEEYQRERGKRRHGEEEEEDRNKRVFNFKFRNFVIFNFVPL